MRHARFLPSVLLASIAFLPAGCPLGGEASTNTPVSAGFNGSTRVATGPPTTGTAGDSTVTDSLTSRYPSCTASAQSDAWRAEMLRLVNQARAEAGLGTLASNETLAAMASEYACELIQFEFFDHVNPVNGSTLDSRADEFGYDFFVIGENLAAGQPTPGEAFNAWMASEGHRDNILDSRFTELGVGLRIGGPFDIYWVQEFGLPATRPDRGDGPPRP
ncbi:MAG: hypothetical protein IH986_03375 [Planctomycetes bacterium]|nr:hypothetical protein [Planctomycetota bacterium]